jgi:hypothetical protein
MLESDQYAPRLWISRPQIYLYSQGAGSHRRSTITAAMVTLYIFGAKYLPG